MVPVEGTEEILPADLVLIAAGFLGSQKYVTDAFKVEVNQRTNVKTDDGKYQTTKKMSSPQAICTAASPWSYGRSARDARQQRQSMNP
mgnify:CR=1 FL=1